MIYPERIRTKQQSGMARDTIAHSESIPVRPVDYVLDHNANYKATDESGKAMRLVTDNGTELCCFCGKPIETSDSCSCNADDYIHRETFGKSCCLMCDKYIVIPNRTIAEEYLERGNTPVIKF